VFEALQRLSAGLSRAALYASALGLMAMTGLIGWQVFARKVLGAAPAWTEQAALFLMLWFILFAAAAGVREGFHIRITLLEDSLNPRAARALRLLAQLAVAGFGLVMAVSGWQLAAATWSHVIPTLGLPRGAAYLPLSGAGVLIVLFALEQAWAELAGKKVAPLWS
jgi:TRAP-type C4-dicarboxylate transport system permease small subunit